jgi:exonuclease SbcD
MRILHTSDWHLGRSFHREDLLSAQAAFVDHLVEVVASERVDVVVVSGDIYDRALPPVDAVQLAHEVLRRLLAARVRVVITSGNHDSAPRLGFAADLIDAAGIHLRTDPAAVGDPVVIADPYGDVAFYGIPYLEPDLIREPWGLAARSHQAALDEAMRRIRADLAGRSTTTRSVAMAHAFVLGGAGSDSERDISVGGVSNVALQTFDGIDYTALGHLHGRHTLSDSVRYSGSPIAYSFSEASHRKGSWLVDLGAPATRLVEFVDAPVPRELALIRGEIDTLLHDAAYTTVEAAWLQVTLTNTIRPSHALERLRQRFPHTLVVKFEPLLAGQDSAAPSPHVITGRPDREVISDFFEVTRSSRPTPEELVLLDAACDVARIDEGIAS